jgi:predicted PurR-regulated permease PerM/methylmalonyl-CoA mutase cobalamin-binding subunit
MRLPGYKENIQKKLQSLHMPAGGRFAEFNKAFAELQENLHANAPAATPTQPVVPASSSTPAVVPSSTPVLTPPLPVTIVDVKHANPLEQIGRVIAPLLGPLGTAALVLLLLTCMLLQREDLRGRMIRLLGLGNISATTRGLDDAARRVARYLLMQLIVNATYGVAVGIGLYFIGVPSAFVWGVLATVLRFIPYVGPWLAAAFPMALSLAVSNSWTMPLLALGLFVVLELLSNNVMEPWLYGASTGVSPIALIVAAVFWTWLWGAPGLVLATPLTVCLVVMGRHIPRLGMLSVLLSNENALLPHEELYHRLLTPNADDAADFATDFVKANSLVEFYDRVCMPALADVERDCKSGELEDQQHTDILQELRDVIEDLGLEPVIASAVAAEGTEAAAKIRATVSPFRVVVLPVRADRDEIAGAMLTQLLLQQGIAAENLTAERTTGELLEIAVHEPGDAFCISAIPPSTVIHARYLCGKLRAKLPKSRIVVAMWGAAEQMADVKDRLRASGADELIFTLPDALSLFARMAASQASVENTSRDLQPPRVECLEVA